MLSRHELSDASALKIMWVAVFLILGCAVMALGIWAFFYVLDVKNSKPLREPPLKYTPISDYLKQEKQLLESYGWVDRDNKIVRIPIQKALEILLYEH